MSETWNIPESWQRAAERILRDDRPIRVMAVGMPDAGKTTFCAFLAETLRRADRSVGVVDADVGQSSLGVPGTISAGRVTQPIQRLSEVPFQMGYFVGDVSPTGHMLACLTGTRLLADRLRAQGVQATIIDTSGLVRGPSGHELKQRKADLLRPTYIVLIRKEGELESLARLWRDRQSFTLIELPSSPAAQMRSPLERRARRAVRFRSFFRAARPITLDLGRVRLRSTRLALGRPLDADTRSRLAEILRQEVLHAQEDTEGWTVVTPGWLSRSFLMEAARQLGVSTIHCIPSFRLGGVFCGLHDDRGRLIDVGLLQSIDFEHGRAVVLAPRAEPPHVHTLELGRIRLAPDGTELDRLRPGDL